MSDDLDDLLRRAMKTLDDQVPPGYFENFPNQTLSRLEDGSMQTDDRPLRSVSATDGSSGTGDGAGKEPAATPSATPVAPQVATGTTKTSASLPKREEDSGLHDIRNLASSQRMRISSKRSSQSSIKSDDELLASASGSWKAVALPEPAKMISLPELAELPPADEVRDLDRARREVLEAKAARSSSKLEAAAPAATAESVAKSAGASAATAAAPASAVEPAVAPIAAARAKAAQPAPAKRAANKNLIAAIGIGVAAAAGLAIFVSTQNRSASTGTQVQAAADTSPKRGLELQELKTVQPKAAPAVTPIEEPPPAPAPAVAAAPPPPEEPVERAKAPVEKPAAKAGKSVGKMVPNVVDEPVEPKKEAEPAKKAAAPGDPDFDKLLKEAGYEQKQTEGPKLDKKSLSGDDIKKGMNGVAGKASACYDGTQGTAVVKLTVAPTGQVQKVAVAGAFAGTPVGACVEAAVRSAQFPPWDGGPQSVNYSYLLSE